MNFKKIEATSFSRTCRLCLSQSTDLYPIFDNINLPGSASLQAQICNTLGIQVSSGDDLPDKICLPCCLCIKEWHAYKLICLSKDVVLRQLADCLPKNSNSKQYFLLENKEEQDYFDASYKENDESIVKMYVKVPSCDVDVDHEQGDKASVVLPEPVEYTLLVVQDNEPSVTEIPKSYESDATRTTEKDFSPEIKSVCSSNEENISIGGLSTSSVSASEMLKHLSCQFCDKVFSRFNNKVAHEKKYHKLKSLSPKKIGNMTSSVKEFVCQVCKKEFSRIDYLRTHEIRVHSIERPFQCDCSLGFVRKHDMIWHQNTHIKPTQRSDGGILLTTQTPHYCAICSIAFSKFESFNLHFKNVHINDEFKCTFCDTRFFSERELLWHKSNTVVSDMVCSLKSFDSELETMLSDQTFLSSSVTVSSDKEASKATFTCSICDHVFSDSNVCKSHVFRVHSSFKTFSCKFCAASFKNNCQSVAHECLKGRVNNSNNVNLLGENVAQSKSNVAFTESNEKLRRNQRRNQGKELFFCVCCARKFSSLERVCAHELRQTCGKNHRCGECGKSFYHSSSLKVHSFTHTDIKPFCCNVCQMRFRTLSNLNAHKKRHSDEPCFICNICGRQFLTISGLHRHKILHSGQKNHDCNVCGKVFYTPEERNRHMRFHTGERKFICEHCGKKFFDASHLRVHSRTHNAGKTYACLNCNVSFDSFAKLKSHERLESHFLKLTMPPSVKGDASQPWDPNLDDSDFDICDGVGEFPSEYLK